MMQAILIDPYTETIEEVEYSGDYKDISALLGCDLFTCVYIDNYDTLYVDDEGLYVDDQKYFKMKGYDQPLAGRGLILGSSDDGNTTDCVADVKHIQDMVEWCPEGMLVEPRFNVIGLGSDEVMEAMTDKALLEMLLGKKALH